MKREYDILHGHKYVSIYKSLRYINNCVYSSKKKKGGGTVATKKGKAQNETHNKHTYSVASCYVNLY
jgi:hypothetical protein